MWTAPRRCCTRSLCSPSAPSPPRSSTSRTSSRTTRRSSSSLNSEYHRVDRVPGFLSIRPSWLSPPLSRKQVLPPLVPTGDTLACWRGGGGSQFGRRDRHSGTLDLVKSLYGEYIPTSRCIFSTFVIAFFLMLYFPSVAESDSDPDSYFCFGSHQAEKMSNIFKSAALFKK